MLLLEFQQPHLQQLICVEGAHSRRQRVPREHWGAVHTSRHPGEGGSTHTDDCATLCERGHCTGLACPGRQIPQVQKEVPAGNSLKSAWAGTASAEPCLTSPLSLLLPTDWT